MARIDLIFDSPTSFSVGGNMENQFQKKILALKNQIESENKDNPHKRRLFSKNLKAKVIKLMIENSLSIKETSDLLGVGFSTIEKWNSKQKKSQSFKKIEISKPINETKTNLPIKEFKKIQISLKALIILVTIETIFQSLIYWRS